LRLAEQDTFRAGRVTAEGRMKTTAANVGKMISVGMLPLGGGAPRQGASDGLLPGRFPAGRPSLPLAGAVTVGFLGLVVEQDHAGGEGEVDAGRAHRFLDRGDHLMPHAQHLVLARVNAPTSEPLKAQLC
jgi:hypothetical protein